jgi:hypothetical protein
MNGQQEKKCAVIINVVVFYVVKYEQKKQKDATYKSTNKVYVNSNNLDFL